MCTRAEVEAALETVLASGLFRPPSKRDSESGIEIALDKKALLRAVALALDKRKVENSNIAEELYPAARDKDKGNVRSTMMRVKKKVGSYYAEAGRKDRIIIEFDNIGYTPHFRSREVATTDEEYFGKHSGRVRWPANVRFCEFAPADLLGKDGAKRDSISLTLLPKEALRPERLRLKAPLALHRWKINALIRKINRVFGGLTREKYWQFLHHEEFPFVDGEDELPRQRDKMLRRHWDEKLRIIQALRRSPASGLKKARLHNIENYLLTKTREDDEATFLHKWNKKFPDETKHNPLQWNGRNVMLVSLEKRSFDRATYECLFCESDHYTYYCVADCSDWIRTKGGLEGLVGRQDEEELEAYLANPQLCHGGFGVAVVVHTSDNKLVIRRRSEGGAADFGESSRLYMSCNEGLMAKRGDDIKPDGTIKPCIEIVKRALRNELVGEDAKVFDLNRRITSCHLTGALLYLPNLSINLCFLVSLDAKLNEIKKLADKAPHAKREFIKFSKMKTRDVEFTRQDICAFVAETRRPAPGDLSADDKTWAAWDEGSLVAIRLALPPSAS